MFYTENMPSEGCYHGLARLYAVIGCPDGEATLPAFREITSTSFFLRQQLTAFSEGATEP